MASKVICYGAQVSPVKEAGPAGANASCQTVVLERPLQPGKKTTIETYSVLIHQQMPRPKQIEQADPQRVLLSASRNILSPYRIASQSTQVRQHNSVVFSLFASDVCIANSWLVGSSCTCR